MTRTCTALASALVAISMLTTGGSMKEAPAVAAASDHSTDTKSTMITYPSADLVFPGNDGKPHEVSYDKNSFMVDGERLNIWSGEIHYWRLPDLNGWRDILQKMRAHGYNAVSLYFFWGLHQSEKGGEFDFTENTIRDIDTLLTIAEEEGLYVIARPGPYINAEISMGGLPAYMTNESGRLRSTDPEVLKASKEWLHAFNEIASEHLVTDGGGSILLYQVENELLDANPERSEFMRELASQVRSDGIDVPLFSNDYNLGGRFRDSASYDLDLYAYDRYPVGFNCSAPRGQISDSETQFRAYATDSPHFITESQGGAFTPWGASYNASDCYSYTDEAFTRQWGVNNIGNGVTAFNFYMAFGGTNWGWTGSPSSGFTSYDYGAGITEDRILTPKAGVQKEIGYFLRGVPHLAEMNPVRPPQPAIESGSRVNVYARQADNGKGSVTGHGSRILALRHSDSNDEGTTKLTLPLTLDSPETADDHGYSIDDRDSSIVYEGNWAPTRDASAAHGTLTRSATPGDTATLNFTGTSVRVIVGTGTDHGDFTVQLDDAAPITITKATVDTEQNKPSQLVAFEKEGLPEGEHTITITNAGSGETSVVSLDAIDTASSQTTADSHAEDSHAQDGEIAWARIPQQEGTFLTLHGRDALLLTADTTIAGKKLYYTTSQVFGEPLPGLMADTQYLVGYAGDPGETVFHFTQQPEVDLPDGVTHTWYARTGELRLNYTHTDEPVTVRITPHESSPSAKPIDLRIITREYATTTWIIHGMRNGVLTPVAIEGPELARTATFKGRHLFLTGSVSQPSSVRVLTPAGITTVSWNGKVLTHGDVARGEVPGPKPISPTTLTFVRASDNEFSTVDLDDSSWVDATDTIAANPRYQGPGPHQGIVLDSNHYGFYEGSVWYRAHYIAASDDPTLKLTGNGGSGVPGQGKDPAFMQVWVNGKYAGAVPAKGTEQSLTVPEGLIEKGQEVVVAVVVHNLGQNLDWSDNGLSKQNRGLYDAVLNNDGPVSWKIIGASPSDISTNNPSGTLYNNGGLQGEREGWHMPDFDDASWEEASTLHSPAGITWYRSEFNLTVPSTQDTAFRLDINSARGIGDDHSQATIFVNGWNTGVYIGDIGPQKSFTIPQAFLNLSGKNTVAIAIAAKSDGQGPESVTLRAIHSTTLPKVTQRGRGFSTPPPSVGPPAKSPRNPTGSSAPGQSER